MNPVKALMLGTIRLYQLTLSPWVGRECRYLPTCSNYAIEAIKLHGAVKGGWLMLRLFVGAVGAEIVRRPPL